MKKIFADVSFFYTRIALVEDGEVVEFICENAENKSLVGNIYAGRIESVLKGMKSCFVDIGMGKNAYLIVEDGFKPKINDTVLVQIKKDAIGKKGPVAEQKLSFTGKFVVLVPNDSRKIGISQKISDENERERIRNIAAYLVPENYGIIVRTEAEGKSAGDFEKEIKTLYEESEKILKHSEYIKPPCLLYQGGSTVINAARDLFGSDIDQFVINDRLYYEGIKNETAQHSERVVLYDGDIPIFENFGIESQLEKIFSKNVWLKSGGFLVIEQTEALVVIDVNTGKFTGKKNFDATIFKTNQEAAVEIAHQIRLRNLTGMIIIDFIDMQNAESCIEIENLLTEEVKKDRIKTTVVGMTELGLMQMTRKKTRVPVLNTISEECKTCLGRGIVPSYSYTADRILKQTAAVFAQTIFDEVTISTGKRIINALKGENGKYIEYIENRYGKKVVLKEIETAAADYFEIEKRKL